MNPERDGGSGLSFDGAEKEGVRGDEERLLDLEMKEEDGGESAGGRNG